MKTYRFLAAALGLGLLIPFVPSRASDHADPQSVLNPFKPQDDPAANITDLHAFLADKDRRAIVEDITIQDPAERKAEVEARIAKADQLVVSLCVRRRLLPAQIGGLETNENLSKYTFRLHLDLDPNMHHFNPADTQQAIDELNRRIKLQTSVRDETRKANPPMGDIRSDADRTEQSKLEALLRQRGQLYAGRQRDELMERLYGGIIPRPEDIAEEAILDFQFDLKPDGANSEAVVVSPNVQGIPGEVNVVTDERKTLQGSKILVEKHDFKPGAINVQGGVFDDPFIFPRFFRGNVVGIVVSIPLDRIRTPTGGSVRGQPILLWATTHKPDGKVSDHVGRSLRTQLPRFGYLNAFHPSRHTAEILRVHSEPNLIENTLTTFIAPLEAHRHYDTAPDVMIYDLALPAKFPNGRWLADDVSKPLAENGETILYELSCSESRQAPRATTNDKPFYSTFPYLASRWTAGQIAEHASPGVHFGDFNLGNYTENLEDAKIAGTFSALKGQRLPDAQDAGAVAPADFNVQVWNSLWKGLTLLFCVVLIAAILAARSPWSKFAVIVYGLFVSCYLYGCDCAWLRWLAAFFVVLFGLVALLAVSKLLQRFAVALIVTAALCALWPMWWPGVKMWFLIALAVLAGGWFFCTKDARGRVLALLVSAAAFWGAWQWTYTPPPAASMAAMAMPQTMPQPPVPTDTPNQRFLRAIVSGLLISGLGLFTLYAWGVRRGIKRAAIENVPELGDQREVEADLQYNGTSFNEVHRTIFKDAYYGSTWGEPNQKPLPVYDVRAADIARGLFSLSKRFLFKDAAKRTLESHADLRGNGPGEKGVRRIIHPNGLCLTGTWEITEKTNYSGYFATDSKGLIITRYSTGLSVRRGEKRTLSMVGKLYPTLDRAKVQRTASFITQDDLGAAYPDGIHDVNLRNAPNITVSKRFPDLVSVLLIGFTFFRVDLRNTIRQLYEIAELGKPANEPTRCPQFMQLRVLSEKVSGGDDTADFRDEILAHVYQRGSQTKRSKPLVFGIEVSDTGEVKGLLDKKLEDTQWRLIGTITVDDAVASYSGDHVIHFHHPKWRNDVNLPGSETGPSKLALLINKIADLYEGILRFLFRGRRTP